MFKSVQTKTEINTETEGTGRKKGGKQMLWPEMEVQARLGVLELEQEQVGGGRGLLGIGTGAQRC